MSKHQLCRNCGHEVEDNYCPACGQRTKTGRLTWGSLIESFTSTFVGDEAYGLRGVNMRMGFLMTWYTVLRHPYTSIVEFIEGCRRKYFNPMAILLMLSTVYAVVFYLVGKEHTPLTRESQHMLIWAVCAYYDYTEMHPAINMLVMLPFMALAMKTVFRKRSGFRYVEYLYIGIFLSIIEITLLLLTLPLNLLFPKLGNFTMVILPLFIYTAFVFKQLFGLKKKRTAVWKTLWTKGLYYTYLFSAAIVLIILSTSIYVGLFMPEKEKTELKNNSKTDNPDGWLFRMIEGALDAWEDEEAKAPAKKETVPADAEPTPAADENTPPDAEEASAKKEQE